MHGPGELLDAQLRFYLLITQAPPEALLELASPFRHHHTSVVIERQDVIGLRPRSAQEEPRALLILLKALEFGADGFFPLFPVKGGELQTALQRSRSWDWTRLSLWRAVLQHPKGALLSLAFLRP